MRKSLVLALLAAAALGAGAEHAFASGSLVVCQSSANGMGEREFQFSLNGGPPVAVGGGRCSGPLLQPAGSVSVQQLASTPTTVTAITTQATRLDRSVSPNPDLAARRIVVHVVEGTGTYSATRVTFTNEAGGIEAAPPPGDEPAPPPGGTAPGGAGALELCKSMAPGEPAFDGRPFGFRIDGRLRVTVRAGRCSPPILVSAGAHAITELLDPAFELASVDTLPPGRVLEQNLATATVTVLVPSGVENETVVLFRNRVARGQVKLCKRVAPGSTDALGGKTFSLSYAYGSPLTTVSVQLRPGECSLPSQPIPVIDGQGNPTLVSVDETPGAGYAVASVGVEFAAGPLQQSGCPTPTPYGCFPLGRNTNVVTFTNRSAS